MSYMNGKAIKLHTIEMIVSNHMCNLEGDFMHHVSSDECKRSNNISDLAHYRYS